MSQVWSIIIQPKSGSVQFNADVFGIGAGQPLKAEVGDLVSWNNQTEEFLQIVTKGSAGHTFVPTAAPFASTSPGYVILQENVIQEKDVDKITIFPEDVGTILYYTTKYGFGPKGKIVVVTS